VQKNAQNPPSKICSVSRALIIAHIHRLFLVLFLMPISLAETMSETLLLKNGETLYVDEYVNAWAGASNEFFLILRCEVDSIEGKHT
jgi:hypothetical protein